jgi:hypothetical protein
MFEAPVEGNFQVKEDIKEDLLLFQKFVTLRDVDIVKCSYLELNPLLSYKKRLVNLAYAIKDSLFPYLEAPVMDEYDEYQLKKDLKHRLKVPLDFQLKEVNKRIKYISNRYPAIYEKLAVYKLIQGCGRAVRNEEDWCDTYFIDGSLNKLFKSRHNLWKNEFKFYKFKE